MDDPASDDDDRPVPDLRAAMRAARVEEAALSQVRAELRAAELARLEILRDAIQPVLDQVPKDVDLFEVGVMPGGVPRLFIDMIAYVEMGQDKRSYRFVQDTRHGRVLLAESDRLGVITEAVAAYIGRRLVEREKALAADRTSPETMRVDGSKPSIEVRTSTDGGAPSCRWLAVVGRVMLEHLGIVALCVLAWFVARWLYVQWLLPPR